MKFLVKIVLFLFLSFLSAPTIVSLMEDEADVSIAYSLAEEEIHKELKEVKVAPVMGYEIPLLTTYTKTTIINTENLQRHENAFEDIFSPPPNQV